MSVRVVLAASALLLMACSGSAAGPTETVAEPTTSTAEGVTSTTSTTQAPTTSSSPGDDGGEPYAPPAPSHTNQDAQELAAALGVDRLLVADGTDFIAVDSGVAVRESDVWPWTDGRFLYWDETSYDEQSGTTSFVGSFAATFDWTVVCEFEDWDIHHVTERADGSLVAGVERPWDWATEEPDFNEGGRVDVPAFAAECSGGSTQPIASFRGYGGDSEWWGVERVAGRVFTFHGDAEGNADFFNESGLLLNGDDIVSSQLYNDDASLALHGIYVGGWASAPRMSIRLRDTTTGQALWSRDFDTPISSLDYDGERVFVGLVPDGEQWQGYDYSTDRIIILDGGDGGVIDEVPTSLWVHYAS